MEAMSKRERVEAALNFKDVDRVPISIWLHYPDKDQDPKSLAEEQVDFIKRYDFDFIKLMPFGLYSAQDWGCKVKFYCTPSEPAVVEEYGIKNVGEWETLKEFPATYSTWGKQLQLTNYVKDMLKEDAPFIQTIFSPLTTARKLAGDRVFTDIKENPKILHEALQVITNTTINFIKANIDAGISGFFFATQCASYDLMTEAEYMEFGSKYDLQLFDEFKDKTYFNVIHIHGQNTMFEMISKYPGNCLNWHDRWISPSLKEARKITNKCLLGGINENDILLKGSPEQIHKHIQEAIESAGKKGLMIGPGCVADPKTPIVNYYASRLAVEGTCSK